MTVGCLDASSAARQARDKRPDAHLSNVRLTQWQGGRATTRAEFDAVDYDRAAARFLGRVVRVEPLDELGRVESTLTANEGDGRLGEGFVELAGAVRLVSGTDVTTTDACTLDLNENLARGSLPVQVQGEGYTAQGAGFTAEMTGERRITLTGGVRMDIETEQP